MHPPLMEGCGKRKGLIRCYDYSFGGDGRAHKVKSKVVLREGTTCKKVVGRVVTQVVLEFLATPSDILGRSPVDMLWSICHG